MYPQLDLPTASDPPTQRQREASLDAAGASVPTPHIQLIASGPGAGPETETTTSDIVSTLTTFSRLPPEEMRALFPVLSTIMATQQPPEASSGDSVLGAPPAYSG